MVRTCASDIGDFLITKPALFHFHRSWRRPLGNLLESAFDRTTGRAWVVIWKSRPCGRSLGKDIATVLKVEVGWEWVEKLCLSTYSPDGYPTRSTHLTDIVARGTIIFWSSEKVETCNACPGGNQRCSRTRSERKHSLQACKDGDRKQRRSLHCRVLYWNTVGWLMGVCVDDGGAKRWERWWMMLYSYRYEWCQNDTSVISLIDFAIKKWGNLEWK